MIQMGERIVLDRVYLTALTNERYLPGVMAMARSLHTVETKNPLAVMIPEEKEEALGRAVREYGILDVPGTFLLPKKFEISEIQSFTPLFWIISSIIGEKLFSNYGPQAVRNLIN